MLAGSQGEAARRTRSGPPGAGVSAGQGAAPAFLARPIPEDAKQPAYSAGADQTSVTRDARRSWRGASHSMAQVPTGQGPRYSGGSKNFEGVSRALP